MLAQDDTVIFTVLLTKADSLIIVLLDGAFIQRSLKSEIMNIHMLATTPYL